MTRCNIKNKKRSNWIRRSRRFSIYARDCFKCTWCKDTIEDVNLTLDHIIPFSKKMDNSSKNLITACRSCNSKRKNKSIIEFSEIISMLTGENSSKIVKRIKDQSKKKLPKLEFDVE